MVWTLADPQNSPKRPFVFVSIAPSALADPSLAIPCASWFLMALQWLGPLALTLLDGHWDAQLGGLSIASVSMYHWFLVICRYLWISRFMTLLQVTTYLFPFAFQHIEFAHSQGGHLAAFKQLSYS